MTSGTPQKTPKEPEWNKTPQGQRSVKKSQATTARKTQEIPQ